MNMLYDYFVRFIKWVGKFFSASSPKEVKDNDASEMYIPLNEQNAEEIKEKLQYKYLEDLDPLTLLWDSKENSRHSVRVLCDRAGLTLAEKNIITACIQQESQFNNKAVGRNSKSSDWGICQINDYWQIGKGRPFSSVADVVENPAKAVSWMISMYKAGKLNLWVSYSSGAYKKYL